MCISEKTGIVTGKKSGYYFLAEKFGCRPYPTKKTRPVRVPPRTIFWRDMNLLIDFTSCPVIGRTRIRPTARGPPKFFIFQKMFSSTTTDSSHDLLLETPGNIFFQETFFPGSTSSLTEITISTFRENSKIKFVKFSWTVIEFWIWSSPWRPWRMKKKIFNSWVNIEPRGDHLLEVPGKINFIFILFPGSTSNHEVIIYSRCPEK